MLAEQIPSIRGMDELNIMESIGEVIAGMPHWLVYLLIAVCPAVSEELLFRVLIGRGLVARHGVFVGVGLTTILFCCRSSSPRPYHCVTATFRGHSCELLSVA